MSYWVYILKTSGNTLYTGQTNDLAQRLVRHKQGKGAKYLRMFDGFELVYQERCESRSAALKRELEIKALSRKEKEELL